MSQSLLDKLSQYKYISFDVFDTLLIRKEKCAEDVFYLMETRLCKENKKFSNFAKKRIEAQVKAQNSDKVEATLDDIYENIDICGIDIDTCKKIELEEEEKNLKANIYLKNLIKYLHKKGKIIIITSDMYLPAKQISYLLKKNGFLFDKIFVSSDYQARKSRGDLFGIVVRNLKIHKKEFIHVGDNYRSDYIMPRLKGINAIHWNMENKLNIHTKVYKEKGEDGKYIYNFLMDWSSSIDNNYKIGYELFGPVLLGFCEWIQDIRIKEGISSIYFLARDGQIVRKAFNLLYPGEYPYILVSRRSLTVPRLTEAENFNDILKIVPYIKRIESIKDLLYKIGLEDPFIVKKIEEKYGKEISRNELLGNKGAWIFKEIVNPMKENAINEQKACNEYFRNKFTENKTGLVDIGWYGTMQAALKRVLKDIGISSKLIGLYFGFLQKNGVNENLEAKGYVFDFKRENIIYQEKLVYGFNGLIELMFTANHGSTKKYYINEDGSPECLLEENKGEYSVFVQKVQAGALHFIEDWSKKTTRKVLDNRILYPALNDLLVNPTKEDCNNLGSLEFYDAYFEKLIKYPGLVNTIRHPKETMKLFLKSNWKIGYLKRMMPFMDAAKLYCIVNKIK